MLSFKRSIQPLAKVAGAFPQYFSTGSRLQSNPCLLGFASHTRSGFSCLNYGLTGQKYARFCGKVDPVLSLLGKFSITPKGYCSATKVPSHEEVRIILLH